MSELWGRFPGSRHYEPDMRGLLAAIPGSSHDDAVSDARRRSAGREAVRVTGNRISITASAPATTARNGALWPW
jgi:hypothetical protein